MKKTWLVLCAVLILLMAAALPFLCVNGSFLHEKEAIYSREKAIEEAVDPVEAELMALLMGMNPAAQEESGPEETAPEPTLSFSGFGLWLAIGAVICAGYLLYEAARKAPLRKALAWTAVLLLPFGLLGARLVYCLVNITFYFSDIKAPQAMLYLWEGGLSVFGAVFFALLAAFLGAKIGRVKARNVLDALCRVLPLFFVLVAASQLSIHTGYGPETEAPLSSLTVSDDGGWRLNTALLLAVTMTVLWVHMLFISRKKSLPEGHTALRTMFLLGCLMIPLESLRRDGHMLWGFVHAEMLLAMLLALPAGMMLVRKNRLWVLLVATLLLSGAVIALEFMLDRSNINDWLLYVVYVLIIAAYIFVGLKWPKRACEAEENNV